MTLKELKELIDDMSESYDEDTPVYMLQQPNWPFIYSVRNVVGSDDLFNPDVEYNDDGEIIDQEDTGEEDTERYILLVEGSQLRYASGTDSSAFEM